MLTKEELLAPRYKAIAIYPNNVFSVGDVVALNELGYYRKEGNIYAAPKWIIENYPHLFKRMKWWQEREVTDMPNYVKIETTSFSEIRPNGSIHMVSKWGMDSGANIEGYWYDFEEVLPATLAEYEDFHQGLNPARSVAPDPQ